MYLASKGLIRRAEPATQLSSFACFRRILGYLWPQKRYVYPALGCIVLVAITYTASISSILPVLYVMIQPEVGLHGWVGQYVDEQRYKCELAVYSRLNDREVPGVPEGAARIRSLKPKSVLYQAGLRQNDFIVGVDGSSGSAISVYRRLAEASGPVNLTYVPAAGGAPRNLTVPAPDQRFYYRAVLKAISWIPDGQSPRERMVTLSVVLTILLGVILFGNSARVMAEYLTAVAIGRSIIDLRRQMYTHMFNLPMSRFSQNINDTISKYMQDMNDIIRGLENFFQKVVTEPIKAVGVTAVAFYLNWQLTVSILLGVPVAAYLFRKLGKIVRRANRKLLMGYGESLSVLESTLSGLRVVKGYMRENYERRRLFQIDRRLLKQRLRIALIEALTPPFIETLGAALGMAAMLYVAHGMFYQGMKPPEFMTMLVCLAGIFDPVRKLSTVYTKIQQANAAAERVFDLVDTPSEYADDAGKPRLSPLERTIEFDDVSFVYANAKRPAVRNVSLTVHRGEMVALVGPNGSGKTTLVSLLPRFFPITSGRILIDGQDINGVSLRSLREQFSLIAQESVMFPDTVRANIGYGRKGATQEEIEAAARKAFADEFIQEMPQGYDTVVGEHGATLSGGQRQRIAIARAILRNAPILIFDEATSQVDPESEQKIHAALEEFIQNRTAFVIAHRYATVRDADRIVVMDNAGIVAVGPHEQLLATCPLYQRLYESQMREAPESPSEIVDESAPSALPG